MTFHYCARSLEGAAVRGSIDAQSRAVAVAHLRARSLVVTLLEPATSPRGALASVAGAFGRGSGTRVAFFRSFAALAGAGVPVKRALDALTQTVRDAVFCEALASVSADVAAGLMLSAAMERHPAEFTAIAIATIRAGEVGGSLDRALQTVAELEERNAALRKRVAAALAYPLTVSVAAIGLVMFLVANTMPSFASMFAQMGVPLPLGTRVLVAAGQSLQRPLPWIACALVLGGVIVCAARYKNSDAAWAATLDRLRLKVPVLGAIASKATTARFARTLGALLSAGVDVVAAMNASIAVVDGFVFRNGLRRALEGLTRGEAMSGQLDATGLFDAVAMQLVRAGEESGCLDAMLVRLAGYYDLEVETALAALGSIVEPALVCVLGVAIGAIVAAIIVPLYSLIGGIR